LDKTAETVSYGGYSQCSSYHNETTVGIGLRITRSRTAVTTTGLNYRIL